MFRLFRRCYSTQILQETLHTMKAELKLINTQLKLQNEERQWRNVSRYIFDANSKQIVCHTKKGQKILIANNVDKFQVRWDSKEIIYERDGQTKIINKNGEKYQAEQDVIFGPPEKRYDGITPGGFDWPSSITCKDKEDYWN